jgi:hypothetical protein
MDEFATHFSRNPDGSWTCISAGTFSGPNGRIQVTPGSTFYRGTMFMGFDLAAWLEIELADGGGESQVPPPADERRHGDRRQHDGGT